MQEKGEERREIMAPTKLLELYEGEEHNFRVSLQALDTPLLEVVELIRQRFRELAERQDAANLPEHDEISVAHFVLTCEERLLKGVLSMMRGHLKDAGRDLRRAIEAAASLVRIRADHRLFMVWVNSEDDEAAERVYRDEFSTGKLLSKTSPSPLVRALRSYYDECSRLSHARLKSFAGTIRKVAGGGAAFQVFDVRAGDPKSFMEPFLWFLDVFVAVLRLLAESYRADLRLDAEWDSKVAAIETRLREERERLPTARIAPPPSA
jgi:hypothetical protein